MIVAIGHEPNAGKDAFVMFATDYLRIRFKGLDIQREGFADRVYDTCYSLYSWAGFKSRQYYLQNPKDKEVILPELGKTPRQILIAVAEKVREFDPDAWLSPVFRNIPKHVKFIPDLRTKEEVKVGRQVNAVLIKIDRPNKPNIDCKISAILKDYNEWDEVIPNHGDLNDFRVKVIDFIDRRVVPHIQKVLMQGKK